MDTAAAPENNVNNINPNILKFAILSKLPPLNIIYLSILNLITNHKINEKELLEKTFATKENKEVIIKEPSTKDECSIIAMAEKNAKETLMQKLYETKSNLNLIYKFSIAFNLV